MFRAASLALLLTAVPASAQMHHACTPGHPCAAQTPTAAPPAAPPPAEVGQSAFAAIQEAVARLQADPKTDWSKVDIDALRQHLVDMNNVTVSANVRNVPTEDGFRFEVTGDGPVRDSIRRIVTAHAGAMNGAGPWLYEASEIDGGAALTVHAQPPDREKLRGLGFFGVITLGIHHQMHHQMIARGQSPHS
jgi:hypothetical protein